MAVEVAEVVVAFAVAVDVVAARHDQAARRQKAVQHFVALDHDLDHLFQLSYFVFTYK